MAMNTQTSECPDLQDLAAWVDGNVDDATRARLVEHVASCSDCFEIVSSTLEWKTESDAAPSPSEQDGAPSEGGVIPFPARRRFPWAAALPLAASLAVAVVGWRVYTAQMRAAQSAAKVAVRAAALAGDDATLQAYAPPGVAASSLVKSVESSATRGGGEAEEGNKGDKHFNCQAAECKKNAILALEKYRRWSRFSRKAQMGFLSTLALVPNELTVYEDQPNLREARRLSRSSDLAVRVSAFYALDVVRLSNPAEVDRLVRSVDSASLNEERAAYFLGRLATSVGNPSVALRAYQRFLELAPRTPSAWRTEAERAVSELKLLSLPPQ